MNWRASLLGLIAVLAWSSAAALELRVDDAGGPTDLAARVDAALEAWSRAGAPLDEIDRTVVVRYESAELLGPDALTLVLTGGPPGVDIEVLVRADAGPRLDDALVIALGVALGGAPGAGVLDPRLQPGAEPRLPTLEDVAALAPSQRLPGDITGDGRIGFADLLRLAETWGQRGVNLPADLDGDGVVGEGDLEILREHYRLAPVSGDGEPPRPPGGPGRLDSGPGAEGADPSPEAEEAPDVPAQDEEPGLEDLEDLDDLDPPDDPFDDPYGDASAPAVRPAATT